MSDRPRVLLGGSGFIGSALTRALLAAGLPVRIADRQPCTVAPHAWQHADVRDEASVARALAGAETLFLLAAEHGTEPRPVERFEETNVGGARAVASAARRAGLRRIVFTSTVAVYGQHRGVRTEDSPCRPRSPYGRTKLEAERILEGWAREDATRSLVIIRPTIVFGPGVRGRMLGLFHEMAAPGFVMIGNGDNRKSFAHVENVAAFHAHAAALGPGVHVFNYADGPDLTLGEVATTIREALGLPTGFPRRSRAVAVIAALLRGTRATEVVGATARSAAQVLRYCSDSRFTSVRRGGLDFAPPRSLREGLAEFARSDLRWIAGAASAPAHGARAGGQHVPAA